MNNIRLIIVLIISITLSALFFTACSNDVENIDNLVDINTMDDIKASSSFEYTTTQVVTVDITYADYNYMALDLYAGSEVTEMSLESSDPFSSLQYIGRFFLDDSANLSMKLSLPSRYDSLVISALHLGLPRVNIVEIGNAKASYTHTSTVIPPTRISPSVSHRATSESTFSYFKDNGYYYLSEFDWSGKPNNVYNPYYEYGDGWEDTDVKVTDELLETINATLPEYSKVWQDDERKDFLIDSNIKIKDLVGSDTDVKVEITFLHEGAGYLNALGYYLVDSTSLESRTSPPEDDESTDEYEGMVVAFPNASYPGGGNLYTGDTIELVDVDPGKTIIWSIMPNGWSRIGRNREYKDRFYSYSEWNPEIPNESDEDERKENIHTVVLLDHKPEGGASSTDPARFIIGFEDLNREPSSTDDDFNDLVFMVTVTPAIAVESLYEPDSLFKETIKTGSDKDNDGVPDAYDKYPQNEHLASLSSYFGYVAFEDQWPTVGDYDFNDLVAKYNYDFALDADNEVRALTYSITFIALGAGWKNGIGLHLPVARSKVSNEESDISDALDEIVSGNLIMSDTVDDIVITISENINDDFFTVNTSEGPTIINTVYPENGEEEPKLVAPETVTDRIYFSKDKHVKLSDFGNLPFDIFLIQGGPVPTGYEIHLPNTPLTGSRDSYEDQRLEFGTKDDGSNESSEIYFKTKGNLPWALHMPTMWTHPLEEHTILQAYPRFGYWASSNGARDSNWYTADNQNENHLFPVDELPE